MPKIHVAVPSLDEEDALPSCLDSIARQTRPPDRIWICVNQPDCWWARPDRVDICRANQRTLSALRRRRDLPIVVLDRSSPGKGWAQVKGGVGRARAELFRAVASHESTCGRDLFVSLDADTIIAPGYIEAVARTFESHPGAVGLAAPYRHSLPKDTALRRAILRYEIYLRAYFLNMASTSSPFVFTALGSAIALPLQAGQKVSGPPAIPAGEDFYLLEKLAKIGPLALWTDEPVQPSSRPSRRVPFGTGPAVAEGVKGNWRSYPIFDPAIFDEVAEALDMLGRLQHQELDHPLFRFLQERSKRPLWAPLRRNHPDPRRFVRACHERIDGLRILQYVRWRSGQTHRSDARNLAETLRRRTVPIMDRLSVRQASILQPALTGDHDPAFLDLRTLETVRDVLMAQEERVRAERTARWQQHLAFYGMSHAQKPGPDRRGMTTA